MTISGTGAMDDWNTYLSVPWSSYRTSITSVIIEDGVTSIGNYAFYGSTNLASIELPSTLTSIGGRAFYGCRVLTSIMIPDDVTSIGDYAFYDCTGLSSVELPFMLTSIGVRAFYGCSDLTGISIPEGVTSIGDYAFAYCLGLVSVDLPSILTSIGNYVFYNCTSLTDISIPEGVTSIGEWAFAFCTSLSELSLSEGLLTIGDWAFYRCPLDGSSMYKAITVNAGAAVYSIDSAKTDTATETTYYEGYTLVIPESVTSVGTSAFAYTSVDIFVIGSNLTNITGSAFASSSFDAIIFDNFQDQVTIDNPKNISSNGSLVYRSGESPLKISVSKEWNDQDNYDGLRPASIDVQLTADGDVVDTQTLSEDNGWSYTWDDLDIYADGHEIVYEVIELETPAGYTQSDTGMVKDDDGNYSITITNAHEVRTIMVYVDKEWDDADNQDGLRPPSVEVQLLADGAEIDTQALSEDNEWSYTWDGLDIYADGIEIVYEVIEPETPDVYTQSDTGMIKDDDGNYSITITNSHETKTTDINVSKLWDDEEDQDGIRPGSVTVDLLADGSIIDTVTLDESNYWHYMWEDLPANAAGSAISYSVEETDVPEGYFADYDGDAPRYLMIANTHIPEIIDISGTMVWDDADNQDGIRPDEITINLLADGAAAVDDNGNAITTTATAADNYAWNFSELPKYRDGGIEIVYSVSEDAADGYEASYGDLIDNDNGTYSLVITNTHTPEQFNATVIKEWDDADDQDGLRPDSVTVHLRADNTYEVASATITPDDEGIWSYTFEGLPRYRDGGVEIVYDVTEDDVWGYVNNPLWLLSEGSASSFELLASDSSTDKSVTITNTHTPEQFDATVIKEWDDADDADGIRPDSVTVHLWADNTYEVASATITPDEDGIWSYTFEGLPKYADGHEIVYSVTEDDVWGYVNDPLWLLSSGSTSSFELMASDSSADKSVTITNTHIPEAETPAPEMSDDVGTGTEVAPGESLTYTIRYTNGDQDGATITITDVLDSGLDFVSATDGGVYDEATRTITWIISDVPANAEGSVSFTAVVNETALSNGEISNSATIQINDEPAVATNIVTNPVKAASTVTFEVVKVWNDNNDLYGARPDRIVVVLLENGQATDLMQLLSAENSWTGTFSDLPEYDANGEKITYSIAEVTVPNYTSVITGDQESGFTVTNTYDFAEITNPDSGNPNTGTPNSGNPDDGVPQTGQDSLPIAPLAVSGAVIVAAGVVLLAVRRRRAA